MQPHVRRFVERAVTFQTCPECAGTRLTSEVLASKVERQEHRRAVRDADQRPGGVGARARRAVGGAAAQGAAAPARLLRRDRARLPLPRPAGRHPLGRRGPAHQDDPAPRLLAHRRHLRLRRAEHRPAPARHRADEPPPAPAARQGQHRARRRAQARDDRHRRPRRRPRPRGRDGRWQRLLRGLRRRPARAATPSRATTSTTARRSRSRCARHPVRWRCVGRRRTTSRAVDVDIPLGVLVRRHRGRRVGQVVADPGVGRQARGRRRHRPGGDQGLAAQQPGDVHRAARAHPQGLREGERRQARPVQLQLRGRLPHLQRRRASSSPTSASWPPSSPRARSARAGGSRRRCSSTPSAARTSPRCWRCPSSRPRRSSPRCGAHAGRAQGPRPARRRRARLPQPRPAADDAVGRRAAAAQAGRPDVREG